MKERIKKIVDNKLFHLIVIMVIILSLLGFLVYVVFRYDVEGETNMPFTLGKISVISSSEGIDKDGGENKWGFDINQNNDIYIYIDKNNDYKKTQIIKSVSVNNFNIESENKEKVKIYRPTSQEEQSIFKCDESNVVNSLEFSGSSESDLKNLKISNQGGIIAFRVANNNVAEYRSDEEEIKHEELLKKANVTNEMLKMKISFNLMIELEDGKKFETLISLDLPEGNVVEEGTTSREITDTQEYIFKRIEN